VKLLDFGIARTPSTARRAVDKKGFFVGTLQYVRRKHFGER